MQALQAHSGPAIFTLLAFFLVDRLGFGAAEGSPGWGLLTPTNDETLHIVIGRVSATMLFTRQESHTLMVLFEFVFFFTSYPGLKGYFNSFFFYY